MARAPHTGSDVTMTDEQKHILALLLIPAFASLLAASSVNVILPSLREDMSASTTAIQWVVSGYALVFGVLLVAAGRAGDLVGRGCLFVSGLALFGLGSLGSGLAPTMTWVNLARLLTGIGSGLLSPQVSGMIQQYFSGNTRGRAFGVFGGVIGVSVAVGPVLAGALVSLLGTSWGWRASFLVNVPIALVAIWVARRVLPASAWRGAAGSPQPGSPQTRSPQTGTPQAGSPQAGSSAAPEASARRRVDLDVVGTVLLTVSTLLVMTPFLATSTTSLRWLALPAAGLTLTAWTLWEAAYTRRGRAPMVDLTLFTQRSFANGCLISALVFLGGTSVWLVIAQYLQAGLGVSAMVSGSIGIPAALASAVVAPLVGRHVLRLGRVLVLIGLLVAIAGLAATMLAVHLTATTGLSHWWMLGTLCLVGLGQGLVTSPNQTLTLVEVPLRYAGTAGGVLQTGQRIGAAIGVTAISSIAFTVSQASGWDRALRLSFLAVIISFAAAAAVAVLDMVAARRG
ncbi:MFS transporter [Actinomyces howellii]|uniref:Spectinomycin tetracycline efflux pump n=1 Tax=Actinomyces howellii TaxID=52771 RepID=A0A3S4RX37_9ACTO|nr:MFS transporter [Actinomyces howellii]VEG28716.1 Spectinomycin tetracycline efflux pump [Actinomyces howellii]